LGAPQRGPAIEEWPRWLARLGDSSPHEPEDGR
jgi:hypothetical protein